MKRKIERILFPASIEDCRVPDHPSAERFDHRGGLTGRFPRRDDVFDDDHALAGLDREAATEGHLSILPFGETEGHAEGARDRVADDQPSQRWRDHALRIEPPELPGERRPELVRMRGKLEQTRALHVVRTVEAGRKTEMPFESGSRLPQQRFEPVHRAGEYQSRIARRLSPDILPRMSKLTERIRTDLTAAMKARDAARLSTLRMVQAALKNEQIEKGRELSDEEAEAIVRRGVKQRNDSIDQYRKGGREDLAAKEESELALLQEYLPQTLDAAGTEALLDEIITKTGASSKKDSGKVMKEIMATHRSSVDGKLVQEILARKLA